MTAQVALQAVPLTHDSDVGEPVPPLTEHAVSVSLPTWAANVGYEEGKDWVISRMKTGYPRFFVHKSIQKLAADIVQKHGSPGQAAMLFPSTTIANKFLHFMTKYPDKPVSIDTVHVLEFVPLNWPQESPQQEVLVSPTIYACLFPQNHYAIAKQFWQHTGCGISSRRAEYCQALLDKGYLSLRKDANSIDAPCKGPRRYQRSASTSEAKANESSTVLPNAEDSSKFIEERFGRNLELSMSSDAKVAIRRRIAGRLLLNVGLDQASALGIRDETNVTGRTISEEDVYLYPCGMNAIYGAQQCLLSARGQLKSVCYGFPYIDTLKILEKFGPGCYFYGHGSADELKQLATRLDGGQKILALFCEFPGNPLLKSPDLATIRTLADKHDFAVVVDESIGNFLNVNVLQFADIVVSSLTKLFSGDSNVMGGSAILNPRSPLYQQLKDTWHREYEDNYWAEDAIFMERNSRDFVSRAERINTNAEAICDLLEKHHRVKQVFYPKISPTRKFYDQCRNEHGGFGGLLSVVFKQPSDAVKFFDELQTYKGPSLGTNFTLSSPYVILAHYTELPWAASFGVDSHLVRFSVGLEETADLVSRFENALAMLDST